MRDTTTSDGTATWSRDQLRGQTETLGFILLIGLIIAGGTLTLVVGSDAIRETKDRTSLSSAEQTMSQFDSQAALVAYGGSDNRQVSIPRDPAGPGGTVVRPNEGKLTIRVDGASTSFNRTVTLGTVVYRQGDKQVAYQGGGVWRADGERSTMVSPPEFDYRLAGQGEPTLTLPLVTIDGEVGGRTTTIRRTGDTDQLLPNESAGRLNPLENGDVNITVSSKYYRAWGAFFEERAQGTVTYNDAANNVTIELRIPREPVTVDSALNSGAASLAIANTGTIDSYDSRVGPYPGSAAENAPVAVNGTLDTSNAATVEGTIQASDDAIIDNSVTVTGKVRVGNDTEIRNGPLFEGEYHTGGNLDVDANNGLIFDDSVFVGGNVTQFDSADMNGNLFVGDDVVIQKATINGDIVAGGNVTVTSQADVNGDIDAGGNVTIRSEVDGDVTAGNSVKIEDGVTVTGGVEATNDLFQSSASGGSEVQGDVTVGGCAEGDGDACDPDGGSDDGTIGGTTSEANPTFTASPTTPVSPDPPNVETPDSPASLISDKRSNFNAPSENDNSGTALADNEINSGECGSGCTLSAGDYFADDDIEVGSGDTLTLDATSGPVEIYVEEQFKIDGGQVEILGSEGVKIYVGDGSNADFTISGNGEVVNSDDRAGELFVYVHPDGSATFENQAVFKGVLYGPNPSGSGATITIQNQAALFGAVLGDASSTSNNNEVHYDEALAVTNAFNTTTTQPKVTYLHISVTEVEAES